MQLVRVVMYFGSYAGVLLCHVMEDGCGLLAVLEVGCVHMWVCVLVLRGNRPVHITRRWYALVK